MKNNQTIKAIGLGLLAYLVWSCGDAATKWVGKGSASPAQIVALSALVAVFLFGGFQAAKGELKALRPNNLKIELPRALLFVGQSFVNIITFTQLPLTTVYAALFASPLLISLAGVLWLNEPMTKKQTFFTLLGFVGALVAVDPFSADLSTGTALGWGLLAFYPLLFSANVLLIRAQRKTESAESLTFFPLLIRTLIGLPIAYLTGNPLSLKDIIVIVVMGTCFITGLALFTKALARAPGNVIAPLHYVQIVMGAIFGYLLWDTVPAPHVVVGAAIIIGAGLANARLVAKRQKNLDALLEIAEP